MTKKEKSDTLLKTAMDIRGAFINDTIFLEKVIDNWLADFFCTNKKRSKALFELILCHDRLGVEAKRQVFLFIIQNYCNDFLKEYPNTSKDLTFIIEKRNILAHWLLDTSDHGIESGNLKFVKFKNSTESQEFTLEIIEDMKAKLKLYRNAISKLVHPPLD